MRTFVDPRERHTFIGWARDAGTHAWHIVRFLGWLALMGAAGAVSVAVPATGAAIAFSTRRKAGGHR